MNDGDRFSLLCEQIVGKRLTYAELTAKEDKKPEAAFQQVSEGPWSAEGVAAFRFLFVPRFGPRLRGLASTSFRYSASRLCISSCGTVNKRSTKFVNLRYSAERFIPPHCNINSSFSLG